MERNVTKYGEISVCRFFKGWFRDTLAARRVPGKVRVAYIDCDLPKATEEALIGIVPALVPNSGVIFSQDYHLPSVRALLTNEDLWARFGVRAFVIRLGSHLARVIFPRST